MLNKQGPGTMIDWTDWSFNPISGCLHNCPYCYLKSMGKRFNRDMMKPAFHSEYLERFKRIRKIKLYDKIFVGSSADMWGNWVPTSWIGFTLHTLQTAMFRQNVVYQFLTKNPGRYDGWDFSENMWLGTTVDGSSRTRNNLFTLVRTVPEHFIRFVSFEPLLKRPFFNLTTFKHLDWIIIGADSTRGAWKPPKKWADYLIATARNFNIPVWVKDNYGYPETIKEFPKTKGANHGCQKTENQK